MRTQVKTLLVIFVALAVTSMAIHQTLKLQGVKVNQLPPARSETHIRTGQPNLYIRNGEPTTDPMPHLTAVGYYLEKLAGTINKPCPEWYIPFLEAGWSESEWATARWVIYRESRCMADAFNGVDAGLMQINEFHAPLIQSYGLRFPDDIFDGETNLWVAYTLWQQYGWKPWTFKGVTPGE